MMIKSSVVPIIITCIAFAMFACELHAECVPNGTFGQLCTPKNECVFSSIFWKAEYMCYKNYGICEDSKNGCAWQQSNTLTSCIEAMRAAVESTDTFSD